MERHLEELLLKRNAALHALISRSLEQLQQCARGQSEAGNVEAICLQVQQFVQSFEPRPELLDQELLVYIDILSSLYLLVRHPQRADATSQALRPDVARGVADIIYSFSKIRGFKHLSNYFSTDVYLVSRLLALKETPQLGDNEVFVILLWLSNVVLVPFELKQIAPDLASRLYAVALSDLTSYSNGSKIQVVSLILLSRLMGRPDQTELLDNYIKELAPQWLDGLLTQAAKLGHMLTLNKMMKSNHHFSQYCPLVESFLKADYELVGSSDFTNMDLLYIIKLSDRMSSLYLSDQATVNYISVATFVNNLFHKLMIPLENRFDTSLRYATARALSNIAMALTKGSINYRDQLISYVLDGFEIPNLNRTAMGSHMDYIVSADYVSVSQYHTLLLTIGYLALKECLPLAFLPQVLGIVHQTLFFTKRRLTTLTGNQIRDASCFILWATFRTVSPAALRSSVQAEILETIAMDIIKVCIFDSDLVIRRCGVAVLQEYVGRLGGGGLPWHYQAIDLGLLVIRFIELFNASSTSTLASSYNIIVSLQHIGFDIGFLLPRLLDTIVSVECVPFEVKKIATKVLIELCSVSKQAERCNTNDVVALLCTSLASAKQEVGPLYTLAKMYDAQLGEDFIKICLEHIRQHFTFNLHTDPLEKAEEFLAFVSALQGTDYAADVKLRDIFFEILKLSHNRSIVQQLQLYFSRVPSNTSLEWYQKVLECIHHDSGNVAEAVGHMQCIPAEIFSQLLEQLESKSISAETRSLLQKSLASYYESHPKAAIDLDSVCRLLDDYTTTNQGDVGSKVRRSTLDLIERNSSLICLIEGWHVAIVPQLLRLAAEPLASLNEKAFRLLHILTNCKSQQATSTEKYYMRLLEYYSHLSLSTSKRAFWSGFVFSTGGAASRSTMNAATGALLDFCDAHPSSKIEIVHHLLELLAISPKGLKGASQRTLKRYVVTLNLVWVLFESSVAYGADLPYNKIYTRCYNLHVNTNKTDRVVLVINIFKHLATCPSIGGKVRQRLCWLSCKHPSAMIREVSAEALYEVATELGNSALCTYISHTKWDVPLSELQQSLEFLQNNID
jgi:hypothetical protein